MRASLLLASASTALAFNATGPYGLHITGKTNSSIDGYVSSYHAGSVTTALFYDEGEFNSSASYQQFYFNYSSFDDVTNAVSPNGWLEWEMPVTIRGDNGSTELTTTALKMELWTNMGSNVAPAVFSLGDTTSYFSYWPENGTLYYPAGEVDDSQLSSSAQPETEPKLGNLTNFHVCDQYVGSYYYRSLAWVATSPSHNPTCQPVDVTLVEI